MPSKKAAMPEIKIKCAHCNKRFSVERTTITAIRSCPRCRQRGDWWTRIAGPDDTQLATPVPLTEGTLASKPPPTQTGKPSPNVIESDPPLQLSGQDQQPPEGLRARLASQATVGPSPVSLPTPSAILYHRPTGAPSEPQYPGPYEQEASAVFKPLAQVATAFFLFGIIISGVLSLSAGYTVAIATRSFASGIVGFIVGTFFVLLASIAGLYLNYLLIKAVCLSIQFLSVLADKSREVSAQREEPHGP